MNKEEKELLGMLDKSFEELAVSRSRGAKANYGSLPNEEKLILHKKMAANYKMADQFNRGEIDEVKFFTIDDNPRVNNFTPTFVREGKVKFMKDGEIVEAEVREFVKTGTNTPLVYENEEGEKIATRVGGVSLKSDVGTTAVKRLTLVKE